MTRKYGLYAANAFVLVCLLFYSSCCTDCPEAKTFAEYLAGTFSTEDITVTKCDNIDVSSAYAGFHIGFVQEADSAKYYVFRYATTNGKLAFASSGKVYFHKDSVSTGIAYGFRNDKYKFQVNDLISNMASGKISMQIFGNADCDITNGRTMIGKCNYLFKSKK